MIEFQAQLIFPTHAVAPPGPLPRGAKRLTLAGGDGAELHGVHIPGTAAGVARRTLILGFAGNAWNSEDAATSLHRMYPECEVVVFHYRGYRPSTGAPSADALMADAPLVYDLAVDLIRPDKTVAVGFSIGSGVAASLVKARQLDGLILVTPFDSLKAVASGLYPYLPVSMFFLHEMNAAAALKRSTVPTAIIAAEHDTLIPAERTDALRRATGKLVYDRTIAGTGHNDIYQRATMGHAMREALAAVTRKP